MRKSFLLLLLFVVGISQAQKKYPLEKVITGKKIKVTEPLRDQPQIVPLETIPEELRIIPNKLKNATKNVATALPLTDDPVIQRNAPTRDPQDLLLSFDGIDVSEGQAVPPDPTGAAGPNHYVHAVNVAVKIFDKSGNLLVGPVSLGSFFNTNVNDGDPIVMYDQLADRWFISQFKQSNDGLLIAISTSPDPTGSYNIFEFELDDFPDYPHYAIWPDAYYLSANKNGDVLYTIDRLALLNNENNPRIISFILPGLVRNNNTVFGAQGANILGTNVPPADSPGYFIYLQDDGWTSAIDFDHLKIWEVNPDFNNAAQSFVTQPQVIATQPFDSTFQPFGTGDVDQPGTGNKIDNIGGVISYKANYRRFNNHNSLVLNFNVNLGDDLSGIRWFELRNTDGNLDYSIFQEGTWTLDDDVSRFMGSINMNEDGDIALAYNVGSNSLKPGIRFTGRKANDPLNEMGFQEQSIIEGVGVQNTGNRFGDYAHMTMDPDGETFWHVAEYFSQDDFWTTRIAAFTLDDLPPLNVISFDKDPYQLDVLPNGDRNYSIILNSVNNLPSEVSFELLDVQGKVVKKGMMNQDGERLIADFSSSEFSSGIFIVSVYDVSKLLVSKKFIIK